MVFLIIIFVLRIRFSGLLPDLRIKFISLYAGQCRYDVEKVYYSLKLHFPWIWGSWILSYSVSQFLWSCVLKLPFSSHSSICGVTIVVERQSLVTVAHYLLLCCQQCCGSVVVVGCSAALMVCMLPSAIVVVVTPYRYCICH